MADPQTPREVIQALGGVSAVARLFGVDIRVVSNWPNMPVLPARTFVTLKDELAAKGMEAIPGVWGMKPAAERISA